MKARRARWARGADKVASWFGGEDRGTDGRGRARIMIDDAEVTVSTVRRSSAIAKAETNKPRGRWAHVHRSKKHPNTVAIIVDVQTAETICRDLATEWRATLPKRPPAFDAKEETASPSDSRVFRIGGTSS